MRHRVLVIDGDKDSRISIKAALADSSVSVVLCSNAGDAIGRLRRRPFDLVLCGSALPEMDGLTLLEVEKEKHADTDFVLIAENASIGGAVEAMRRGATDYLPKPVDPAILKDIVAEILDRRDLELKVEYLKERLDEQYSIDSILTRSPALQAVLKQISAVAKTDSTVLIQGETGVGKELVANVIHTEGSRRMGPFVAINCGALPDTLIESELFGYEKGAFTGADRSQPGKFEFAAGGTVFLDEISSISPAMQVKLLRVLQERKLSHLGSNEIIPVDVRVICATNRDPCRPRAEARHRPRIPWGDPARPDVQIQLGKVLPPIAHGSLRQRFQRCAPDTASRPRPGDLER